MNTLVIGTYSHVGKFCLGREHTRAYLYLQMEVDEVGNKKFREMTYVQKTYPTT